jgi:predicted transcriptional regulator
LLGLIQRHPATAGQLAQEFNVPVEQISLSLETLEASGALHKEERGGAVYYCCRG